MRFLRQPNRDCRRKCESSCRPHKWTFSPPFPLTRSGRSFIAASNGGYAPHNRPFCGSCGEPRSGRTFSPSGRLGEGQNLEGSCYQSPAGNPGPQRGSTQFRRAFMSAYGARIAAAARSCLRSPPLSGVPGSCCPMPRPKREPQIPILPGDANDDHTAAGGRARDVLRRRWTAT